MCTYLYEVFFNHDKFGSNFVFAHNVAIIIHRYSFINIQYAIFTAKIKNCSLLVMVQSLLYGKGREEIRKYYLRD